MIRFTFKCFEIFLIFSIIFVRKISCNSGELRTDFTNDATNFHKRMKIAQQAAVRFAISILIAVVLVCRTKIGGKYWREQL